MKIRSNKECVLGIDGYLFKPGIDTEVPDYVYENSADLKLSVEKGFLIISEKNVKPITKQVFRAETVEAKKLEMPYIFEGMSVKDVIKEIKDIDNPKFLENIIRLDNRQGVKDAALRKLNKIKS